MRTAFFGDSAIRRYYQAGHLIGNQRGGPGDIENLVPMAADFNMSGAWHSFEDWLAKCVGDNRNAYMTVTVAYGNTTTWIPRSFNVHLQFSFASEGGPAGTRD